MEDSFEHSFHTAIGHAPFAFQSRLAEAPELPTVLHIPTGLGKFAAVFMAWVWRRRFHPDPVVRGQTPRRLVYCLPMRTLVYQVVQEANRMLRKLSEGGLLPAADIPIHSVVGGEADDDWLLTPEREAIVVGTQDMLMSRALARGYGLSRFQWPVAFGALNNDALWCFDEVQLMGATIPTSAQLAAFRSTLGAFGPNHTLWISATISEEWLDTVDHPPPPRERWLTLDASDSESPELRKRIGAEKRLQVLEDPARPGTKLSPQALRNAVMAAHKPGSQTICVFNTVDRATALFTALRKHTDTNGPDLVLLHSRFRKPDREAQLRRILTPPDPKGPGRIVVSTQVIEAGVDITSRVLITELAPWPSLVQRFGRCNRLGECEEGADVYWIDLGSKESAPYRSDDLDQAREVLVGLSGTSVSPDSLPNVPMPLPETDTLRAKDIIDLFDTTPDLSGNEIDISRFVRTSDQLDVSVYWRDWDRQDTREAPPTDSHKPERDELCSIPIGELRDAVDAGNQAWIWDWLGERWRPLSPALIRPGIVALFHVDEGGYLPEVGWAPKSKRRVETVGTLSQSPIHTDTHRDDSGSLHSPWQTLEEHTQWVVAELDRLLQCIRIGQLQMWAAPLRTAAIWHDRGKAHAVMQHTLTSDLKHPPPRRDVWAKSPRAAGRHSRRHFRHEVASALAFLQHTRGKEDIHTVLATFLIASHHGRARLTLRSLPDEARPVDDATGKRRHVLGIFDGDPLPEVRLSSRLVAPAVELDLSVMEMGRGLAGPSWVERMTQLRDDPRLGVFRLAYLELLLRTADVLASRAAKEEAP